MMGKVLFSLISANPPAGSTSEGDKPKRI